MEKNKRGGARPGSGRPRGDSKLYSFRCPGKLARQLDEKTNRTEFINKSIETALKKEKRLPSHVGESFRATAIRPMALPYFDVRVTAGFPAPLDNDERSQDIDVLKMLCPHPEASYLIRIKGDSMIDAGVMDGDIVIVDKSNRNPGPKEIAMCELNGEYTIKHFIEKDGEGLLVPANPAYAPRPVHKEDDFNIWGTVTYIIHKARD